MKNLKPIKFWPAFWSIVAALGVFPLMGLVWSVYSQDWQFFKLSLVMDLPFVILLLAITILMTVFHFIKKWINQRKGKLNSN
jgi:hypothetical protein